MAAQERAEDPVVLLTRPRPASEAFAAHLEQVAGRHVPHVISPVLEIVPLEDAPDLGTDETLIFTSGNGVSHAGKDGALRGRRVLTVGRRTADQAAEAGAQATCLGSDVEAFLAAIWRDPPADRLLHLRGVHARGDLAQRLSEGGVPCDEAVVYDQRQRPLTRAALAVLSGASPVVLPLFSPRSARLLSAYDVSAPLCVVAISAATREDWRGAGRAFVAAEATASAMATAVMDALSDTSVGRSPPAH